MKNQSFYTATFVTPEGHHLPYTVTGPVGAPPLLMLHGFVSHRGVWRKTMAALQDRYRCVALDLLGFGDSPKPMNGDYSLQAQGRRVLALADALGFETFTLLGHSMGGQVALLLAAQLAPARVIGLVSVAGVVTGQLTPVVEYVSYPQILLGVQAPWLYTLWRHWATHPVSAQVMFRAWFYRMEALLFAEWSEDRRLALQPGIHIPAFRAAQAIRTSDLTSHLAGITTPTLVIFGRQDATVPVSDGQVVVQQVASSELVLIDQCGHFPMYEKPQHYFAALNPFMDELVSLLPPSR